MTFDWVNIKDVGDAIIEKYDSGDYVFNNFLIEKAREWQDSGETVTYVFVDSEEILTGAYSRIYGYASINTFGLYYGEADKNKCLPCVEIRMFSIAKELRKRHDPTIKWSEIVFKVLLQNLYNMSTSIVGFRAVFLYANTNGYNLYKECGFQEIDEYLIPETDDKVEVEGCTPLLLVINDNAIYDMFDTDNI